MSGRRDLHFLMRADKKKSAEEKLAECAKETLSVIWQ
jgi:hypothetical protein